MKNILRILFSALALTLPGTVQAQTVNAYDKGNGLLVVVTDMLPVVSAVSITQNFGTIPDLPNGGQISVAQILFENPTWNFYAYRASDGYCDDLSWSNWNAFARSFGATVAVFYDGRDSMFIPYNDYDFNYQDAGNSTPTDYLFGTGLITSGDTRTFTVTFYVGLPVAYRQFTFTLPVQPYIKAPCDPAYTPAPPPPPSNKKNNRNKH